jgi:exosortase
METEFTGKQNVKVRSSRSYWIKEGWENKADRRREIMKWLIVAVPFLYLWWVLIDQLRVEWGVNPQYVHGWVVPFLCLALLSLRWQTVKSSADAPEYLPGAGFTGKTAVFFAFLALLWLPTRLVQEANPEWRMISWLLALEVIGLTFAAFWLRLGRAWALQLAFPLFFFLVSVPWPTLVEGPLIQSLTAICAACSVEVVNVMGFPAIQHGNVIEVATGMVGIDEACSGIRSFQATLMISLFLGEFYELGLLRRIVLVPAGFLMALLFNIVRISFLTIEAAHEGTGAVDKYHDPAGLTIMVASIFAIWLLALLMKGRPKGLLPASTILSRGLGPPSPALRRLALGLFLWLVVVETSVELWYRVHEWRLPPSVTWAINWPRNNGTYSDQPIEERARRLLRYDEAVNASWQETDGIEWRMLYLRWLPGRTAVHLAKLHTPEVCITAAGHTVETLPDISYLTIHGLSLPFRKYIVRDSGEPSYVFYCLWEDRAKTQYFNTQLLTYDNRLLPVWEGRRNSGERSLEIVTHGFHDVSDAEAALVQQLDKRLKVSDPSAGPKT